MTSINAIRFNHYEGVCICDESISSTDSMRIDVSDKFQPCIPEVIAKNYGTVAAIASTGTCSVGGKAKESFSDRILRLYEREIEKHGKPALKFLTLREMSALLFDIIVDMKYEALSQRIMGTHGFSAAEFIEGRYRRGEKSFEIKDKDTIRDISALLCWKYQQEEVAFIFNNAFLLAGYDEEEGFSIFHHDLRSGHWHKVQNCYLAEGSGRHSVDPAMYAFAENLLVKNRRGDIDRVAGLMAVIHAVNTAAEHEIGVGGYPNVIVIDGRQADPAKRLYEVNDERSFLGTQVMRAVAGNYLDYRDGYTLIEKIFYGLCPFAEMHDQFWSKARDKAALSRLLRGYKMSPWEHNLV